MDKEHIKFMHQDIALAMSVWKLNNKNLQNVPISFAMCIWSLGCK
jgi:hypothetical protein